MLEDALQRKPNEWWRLKILETNRSNPTEVWGELTRPYDVRELYAAAHSKRELSRAPHGLFRQLAPGNMRHAQEFLRKFGPLNLQTGTRLYGKGAHIGVSLEEFWRLHLRFCMTADLYESLHDRDCLIKIFMKLDKRREEAREDFPFGLELSPPPAKSERKYIFPWQQSSQQPEEWLRKATLDELRTTALYLINLELNVHMRERRIVWYRGWEPSGEMFRPIIWLDSLWSAIWEFFGMDTTGSTWRRCPHCQQLFYPKRKDQFYCTRTQQALASKREYARRMRAKKSKATLPKSSTKGGQVQKGDPR